MHSWQDSRQSQSDGKRVSPEEREKRSEAGFSRGRYEAHHAAVSAFFLLSSIAPLSSPSSLREKKSTIIAAAALLAALSSVASTSPVNSALAPRAWADVPSPGFVGYLNPQTRGWDAATVQSGPCGFTSVGNRSDWPLSGGNLIVGFQGQGQDAVAYYTLDRNPSNSSDWKQISELGGATEGNTCFTAPDFSGAGATAGDPVTFQVRYTLRSIPMYACADAKLVDNSAYTVPAYAPTCEDTAKSTDLTFSGHERYSTDSAGDWEVNSAAVASMYGTSMSAAGAGATTASAPAATGTSNGAGITGTASSVMALGAVAAVAALM